MAKDILTVHYNRINADYDNWSLWVWDKTENREGFEVKIYSFDEFGAVFKVNLTENNLYGKEIGLLPKYKNWEMKESFDRIFKHNGEEDVYIIEGIDKVYRTKYEIHIDSEIRNAFYDHDEIRVIFNRKMHREFIVKENFQIKTDNKTISLRVKNDTGDYSNIFYLLPDEKLDFENIRQGKYKLISKNFKEITITPGKILYTLSSDKKLGEIIEKDRIVLRTFAPEVNHLFLLIKKDVNDAEKEIPFNYTGNGVWELELSTDNINSIYRYKAVYTDKTLYGIDPNTKCSIFNNTYAILTDDKTPVKDSPQFDLSKLIIYELSIRDFSSDEFSGIKNKSKYLSFTEETTFHPKFQDLKTGISHLKELGITAVQIMPFFDFENDENSDEYNWGYMPVSFNSPEGQYAVDKTSGKIKEAKMMIDALHRNGIKVIMDVVYNHTAESKDKIYNFNAVAYDYYYRKREDNSYYNGSGCGNEFKTESPYGYKFMLDSLKYWIEEYKIDGFRFDLMGLIDQQSVIKLIEELRKIKPDLIIYGEPWAAGETPVHGVYKGFQKGKGFAVFNDAFRDGIKGNVFHIEDLGYVEAGNYSHLIKKGIRGSVELFTETPSETINYVTCHDNHTLYDRLKISLPQEKLDTIVKMHKLAHSIILVSQGIPFIQSGEEFLRTKKGNHNSYNAGDEINRIDWSRKKIFYDTFKYYRDLIELRRKYSKIFLMQTKRELYENLKFFDEIEIPLPDDKTIGFVIYANEYGYDIKKLCVLINPNRDHATFTLPEGKWYEVFNENGSVKFPQPVASKVTLPEISMMILTE